MKRRTNIDWSKHEVIEIKEEHSLIHKIKMPGTSTNSVIFINSCGILAVTGDFGNWIFCREFHPAAAGGVSDSYWMEKMRIASCQEPGKYNSELTEKMLKEETKEVEEEWDNGERKDEYLAHLKDGLELLDDELDYMYHVYRDRPGFMDFEGVIFEKTTGYWIDAIFDAFEEICLRMKIKEQELNGSVATK